MKRKGFTLIELSIVLIIIGLIIGGVMKGKDLISSAEHKNIYTTWIKAWQVAANTYQDRTGSLLADGLANGGTATAENGQMETVSLSTATTVQDALKKVGVDVPTSNITGTAGAGGSYSFKGKYATGTSVMSMTYGTASNGGKNRLSMTNIPLDIAIAFDKITDGKLDSGDGAFRLTGNIASGTPWADASTAAVVTVTLEL